MGGRSLGNSRLKAAFLVSFALFGAEALACLPNEILVAPGVCEAPAENSDSGLDALVGSEPEWAYLNELEQVEEWVDVYKPNGATELSLECPTQYFCRQDATAPEKKCYDSGGWTKLPAARMVPAPGGRGEMQEETTEPVTLVEFKKVKYVDLQKLSDTCFHVEEAIETHIGGHSMAPDMVPTGSKLYLLARGREPTIREILGYSGSLRVDGFKSIGRFRRGLLPGGPLMEGQVRIKGPTHVGELQMKGDLYLESVNADLVVLEGKAHFKETNIKTFLWKITPTKFFVGSCTAKGCKGRTKVIGKDNIPRNLH